MTLMKALFCHDHTYYRAEGAGDNILSKGQYHHAIWDRYLQHFDHLTVIGRDGGVIDPAEDAGINRSSCDHVSFALLRNINTPRAFFQSRKDIDDAIQKLVADHDVIILRGISTFGRLAFLEAKRQGKVIALEMVADAWDESWYHGSLKARAYAFYHYAVARYLAWHADAVIYVSQTILQRRYPTRARITARASNVHLPYEAMGTLQFEVSPRDSSFKIGLIGTFKNKLKGVAVAIEAVKILRDRGVHRIKLHILGPGDPAPFLKNAAEGMVVADGLRESGQAVWDWLRDKDLYIQPSFQEGVPRAMIEAMAQGLPCIGSNAGGIPELLDRDCIVKRGNACALADKIEWMISHQNVMQTQREKNLKTAESYMADRLDRIRFDFWSNVKAISSKL